MKAERRHELHQNDLAQWLGKALEWIKAHRNHITTTVLAVAIVFLVWVLVAKHLRAREAAVYEEYRLAVNPVSEADRLERLNAVADQTRNLFLSAKANLELGDLFALKLATGTDTVDAAQQAAWLAAAKEHYTRLTQPKFANLKPLVAMAYLGLGNLAANERNFDEAEAWFKKAQDTAPEGYPVHTSAAIALDSLPQVRAVREQFAAAAPADMTPSTDPADVDSLLRNMMLPGAAE
ncbi:MAG: hypothetical protein FWE88_01800 [Phycisphaerae bacterium]|nr:hypothetical protein [Phycisphaerae bacterium]